MIVRPTKRRDERIASERSVRVCIDAKDRERTEPDGAGKSGSSLKNAAEA
jgi:hypothetical protein